MACRPWSPCTAVYPCSSPCPCPAGPTGPATPAGPSAYVEAEVSQSSGSALTLLPAVPTAITFNSVASGNAGTAFNPINGTFQALLPGVYSIAFEGLVVAGTPGQASVNVTINVNGKAVAAQQHLVTLALNNTLPVSISTVMPLAASDSVQIVCNSNAIDWSWQTSLAPAPSSAVLKVISLF